MHTDDPRLTAYVLGELDPPAQADIERLLREDPEAVREVESLRAFTIAIRTQLATETAPALEPAQKQEILSVAEASRDPATAAAIVRFKVAERPAKPTANWLRVWIPATLAACLAVGCVIAMLMNSPSSRYAARTTAAAEGKQHVAPLNMEVKLSEEDLKDAPAAPALTLPSLSAQDRPNSNPEPTLAPSPMPRERSTSTRMLLATNGGPAPASLVPPAASAAAPAPATAGLPAAAPEEPSGDRSTAFYSGALPGGSASGGERLQGGIALGTQPAKPIARMPATVALSKSMEPRKEAPAQVGKPMVGGRAGGMDGSKLARNEVLSIAPAAPALGRDKRAFQFSDDSGAIDAITAKPASTAPAEVALAQSVSDPETPAKNLQEARKALGDEAEINRGDLGLKARGLEQSERSNTESYDYVTDNAFLPVPGNELSTFSVDVDTASYANVRRFLTAGERPPKGAVRIEELINYFSYDYPPAKDGEPFSVNMEVATCPWTAGHRLVRVGLKAREIAAEKRPEANLVFLVDVSGSMEPANKLPLVKESLRLLVDKLAPHDTVGIAVYAGASGTVLEPTNDKEKIREALGRLDAGGSTNGAAGIRLAYDLAKKNFSKEKTNRVILATDGDFNVGTTNQSELIDLITKKAKSGVFLTVLGFGYGNLKDSTMEKLADKGNGNYAYIDTLAEGRKVLVEQMAGTLFTVAKDVKIQVEFNPAQVNSYRLIGYENRMLAKEDFNDDRKDAGEVGAGQAVTALYEVVPAGVDVRDLTKADGLRYQQTHVLAAADRDVHRYVEEKAKEGRSDLESLYNHPVATAVRAPADSAGVESEVKLTKDKLPVDPNELLTLKLRWKAPDSDTSTKREYPLKDSGESWEKSSKDYRWAAAVAGFGMMLRDSSYKGQANWSSIRELAVEGKGEDANGYRKEFIELLDKASNGATGNGIRESQPSK